MTIKKISNNGGIWADTGTKAAVPSELSLAKIAEGWVSGASADRPYIEYFNYLQNRIDDTVNRIITERGLSAYEDATDVYKMITTQLWEEPWGMIQGDQNMIGDSGPAKEYIDMCTYINSAGDPFILLLEAGAGVIELWNPRTLQIVITTNALDDDLDTTGTQTWVPVSFCCDNTYVYVAFTDTNPLPDTHCVQCYTISESSADWLVRNTGAGTWPATGRDLTPTGNGVVGRCKDLKIIIADDDYVVVSNGGTMAATSASELLELLDRTDGSIDDAGCGDCTVGGGAQFYATEGLASDGTNIYFLATDVNAAPDDTLLCTATIADLTAGCGGAGYPYSLPVAGGADAEGGRICQIGEGCIATIFNQNPESAIGTTNTPIVISTAANAGATLIEVGNLGCGETGEDYIGYEWLDVKFDGLHMWVFASPKDSDDGNARRMKLIKIDVAKLSKTGGGDNLWISDLTNSIFHVKPGGAYPVADLDDAKNTGICFDGRDIWVSFEPRASQTYSGEVYRLPLAVWRH